MLCLQMQQVQLSIAKLEAEIRKLQSEAAVNLAKVQDTAEVQPQLKIAELQQELEIRMQELQLRRELADLTNQTRRVGAETTAATKLATTAMSTAAKKAQNPQPSLGVTNGRLGNQG